jgi:5-methylcytosine-specific restriction endonuclease McrA
MKSTRKDAKADGSDRYFTGKECIRGHVGLRSVASGRCCECDRIKSQEWRKENPEKLKEIQARFEVTTRKNKSDEYKAGRNRQKREYAERRKEYFRELKRKNYADNKVELLKKMKIWRHENKEIIKVLNADYRGRKRGAEGAILISVVRSLEEYQGLKCNHCSTCIREKYHIDHNIPLSRGGSNKRENLQLLCPPCNLRKGALTQAEFEKREAAQ